MEKTEIMTSQIYSDISNLIDACKHSVLHQVNNEMVMLYWNIGKYLVCNVLEENKAEYGKKVVAELSEKLTFNYGKGFEKTALFSNRR